MLSAIAGSWVWCAEGSPFAMLFKMVGFANALLVKWYGWF